MVFTYQVKNLETNVTKLSVLGPLQKMCNLMDLVIVFMRLVLRMISVDALLVNIGLKQPHFG